MSGALSPCPRARSDRRLSLGSGVAAARYCTRGGRRSASVRRHNVASLSLLFRPSISHFITYSPRYSSTSSGGSEISKPVRGFSFPGQVDRPVAPVVAPAEVAAAVGEDGLSPGWTRSAVPHVRSRL